MNIVELLLYCPQYRPLLLMIGLIMLVLLLTANATPPRSRSRRKATEPIQQVLVEYANRFDDVQRSANDRRREAANNFVEDVNNILGGKS